VLAKTNVRSGSPTADIRRRALVKLSRRLAGEEMTKGDLERLWAMAKIEASDDPAGLLCTWTETESAWRGKLQQPGDSAVRLRTISGDLAEAKRV
jgi:hypothetical protein